MSRIRVYPSVARPIDVCVSAESQPVSPEIRERLAGFFFSPQVSRDGVELGKSRDERFHISVGNFQW